MYKLAVKTQNLILMIKSMFKFHTLVCKCSSMEPHFAFFSLRSAAMQLKKRFVRTQI